MTHIYTDTVSRILAARQASHTLPPEEAVQPLLLRQHFNVANEARHLQGAAWSDYLNRILDVNMPRSHRSNGFRGALDTYVMRELIYLDSRTDAFVQTRTNARISTDNMRDYCFHVAIDGIVETVTGALTPRKSEQFVPGILALDMHQKMRMVRPTYARVLAFFLPRAVVEASIPDAPSLHGRVLTYTSPLARLLLLHLRTLCNELPLLSDAAAEHAIRSCAHLILAAFSKQLELEQGTRAAARDVVRHQVQHFVKQHLRDPQLTPELIRINFQLSRPTLYRIFEPEGGLATYIRNCRLRAAATDLIDMPQLSVMTIAEDFSFGSPSDFTRAFRRAYGISPQDFRGLGMEELRR